MIPDELQDAFYAGQRSDHLPFCINDTVRVLYGRKPGEYAAVISIHAVDAELIYLIEYGDGSDDLVAVRKLKSEE